MNTVEKIIQQQRTKRFQTFLEGFPHAALIKVIDYYSLTCASRTQKRSLCKAIREANLNPQDVWKALLSTHK